jgi:hypothetical protein
MDAAVTQRLVLTEGHYDDCECDHVYRPLELGYKHNVKVALDFYKLSTLYCEKCGEVIEVVSSRDD